MAPTVKNLFSSLLVLSAAIASCGDAAQTDKPTATTTETPAATPEKTKNFDGIQFASNKDTICGMPLTAGIEDTMMIDGKIYGFCATGCKEEFAKVLAENKK